MTAELFLAGSADPGARTAGKAGVYADRLQLIDELEGADAVLIGVPMYNVASSPRSGNARQRDTPARDSPFGGLQGQGQARHRGLQPRRLLRAGTLAVVTAKRSPSAPPPRHPTSFRVAGGDSLIGSRW